MGLLSEGTPLSWPQTKALCDHVRHHGIQQFINQYATLKNRTGDCLKWGDEIEYVIVKFDHEKRKATVSLRGSDLLKVLREAEEKNPKEVKSLWRPEYAEYMVEGTPGHPYGSLVQHFNIVEHNMIYRRNELKLLLEPDEIALSITNFPRLGCPDFTWPPAVPDPLGGPGRSLFFPEEAITQSHPRFKTLTANIRQRRGEKVAINVPIFVDKNTPRPFTEDFYSLCHGKHDSKEIIATQESFHNDIEYRDKSTLFCGGTHEAAKEDHIYMDAMGFGMGCCCLQMTFQTRSVTEARVLYDHLTPVCPVMLALTAATPIYRGYLSDVDCRWDVISASVDCRTREERGLEPLKNDKFVLSKSRYSSVDMYLSECGEKYNDADVKYDQAIYDKLRSDNVDHSLAKHIAHLFTRDSISLFSERVNQNDEVELDHFENIQSTNWQTMRFKVPPANSDIGWRVEFRPCEVQITDFENAALGVFIVLLTRAILSFSLNMLIPISKVDENMERSQRKDAVLKQKFWFRSNIFSRTCREDDEYTEMSVDEIFNGRPDGFVGLIPLVKKYLGSIDTDADTACTISQYLKLVSQRASGEAMTAAHWIRKFVTSHKDYKQDSIVNDSINYDLLIALGEITEGKRECPELLGGTPKSRTAQDIPLAVKKRLMQGCPLGK